MKAFLTTVCLLMVASLMAQVGVSMIASTSNYGSATNTGVAAGPGTTGFSLCSSSCNVSLPQIYISNETVNEWEGVVYVTVSIAPSSAKTISVKYMTKNGSAKHPKDYDKVFGTIQFSPGEAFKKIAVPIVSDNVGEEEEDFFVELSQPVNATLHDESGRVTINDVASRPGASLVVPFAATATPNPSAGDFLITVSGEKVSPIKLQVYDAVGRLVKTFAAQPGNSIRIGEDWRAGVYTVKVMQRKDTVTLKLVKM